MSQISYKLRAVFKILFSYTPYVISYLCLSTQMFLF